MGFAGTAGTAGATGLTGVLLTWFGASFNSPDVLDASQINLPVAVVDRRDLALVKEWTSETLDVSGEAPFPHECAYFNFTSANDDTFCDSFTIGRVQPSTINVALERALRCAAASETDCVLSFEIGFGLPAVFLEDHSSDAGVKALLAPRLLPLPSEQVYVRVAVPDDRYNTKTVIFNETINVEFMDERKRVLTGELSGSQAFCVQLLRVSYDNACWAKLDG
jgi:hypothetical protein